MSRFLWCVVAAATFSLWAAAENRSLSAAGDWEVNYTDNEGTHSAAMRLEQSGENVKDTVTGRGLADGVIEGRVEDRKFKFDVRFYNSRRQLTDPVACEATLETSAMKGYCRQHKQSWEGKRRP